MADRILGFLVWQGARLYVRRRFRGFRRTAIVAGLGVVVVAGVVAAGRQASSASHEPLVFGKTQ